MAKRYQIWNKTDDIYTPSGDFFSANDWANKYPWVRIPGTKMIITTGVINGGVAMEWEKTVEFYRNQGADIQDGMSDDEILTAIENFEDNPPKSDESTAEERIAAALELQNLMNMPDIVVDDID